MNQATLALVFAVIATFANALGMILFKMAYIKAENINRNFAFTWQYIVGFLLVVLGALLSVVSS